MIIKPALVDAALRHELVLFAGAGMSAKAIGFGGAHLREALGREIRREFPDYDLGQRTLEDVCDEYAALNDRTALVYRLADLIQQNVPPLPSHIAAVKAFRFTVTTNWDLMFEGAYQHIGQRYQRLVREEDAPSFNYDQHNLIKLHGSVDAPLTLVATSEDYECYPDTHRALLDRVRELLYNNTVLFVGYGIRDEHVRRLLARIRGQRGEWARRAYAVGFYDEVRTRLLDKRNTEVLPYKAEEFLPELIARAGIT